MLGDFAPVLHLTIILLIPFVVYLVYELDEGLLHLLVAAVLEENDCI